MCMCMCMCVCVCVCGGGGGGGGPGIPYVIGTKCPHKNSIVISVNFDLVGTFYGPHEETSL